MRHAALASLLTAFAAAQSTPGLTWTPILSIFSPSPYYASNGINNLAYTLATSAQNLSTSVNAIVSAANVSASVSQNVTSQVNLIAALITTNNQFWKTATDAENEVCTIATSISEQNVAAQIVNLEIGIQAQVQVVAQLQKNIALAISNGLNETGGFSKSEAAITASLISAIVTSVQASFAPIQLLISGLAAIGFTTLGSTFVQVQTSIQALSATAANVSITPAS